MRFFLSATSALALLASAKLPMDLGMKVGECGPKATASYAEPESCSGKVLR